MTKNCYLVGSHFAGMSFLMKEDEPFDPVPVSFFGSQAQVSKTRDVPNLLAKFLLRHRSHNT
jgi:acyl-CoA synthetase (AMP-forming)/AMP-acid ligase II